MAAPQIPNLLAGRGRGRPRGRGGQHSDSASGIGHLGTQAQNDKIVQQTDVDASISRVSAVQAGLLQDDFASDLAPPPPPGGAHRRFPIINRGTYARTTAMDRLVESFLQAEPKVRKQVISLGAGSDTRYFRLRSWPDPPDVLYHELDFAENTHLKLAVVRKMPTLHELIGDPSSITWTANEIHGHNFHLHAIDLRSLVDSESQAGVSGVLKDVSPDIPTLLLSECCLTYLKSDTADAVIKYFVSSRLNPSTPVGLALYEPINPFDPFGKVMVSNLASRGIVLQTLHRYSSLEAQVARLIAYGLKGGQRAVDVDFLYENWIQEDEKARVAQVEMLDEVEELHLLLQHYCVAWGWRNGSDGGALVWDGWKVLENQQHGT